MNFVIDFAGLVMCKGHTKYIYCMMVLAWKSKLLWHDKRITHNHTHELQALVQWQLNDCEYTNWLFLWHFLCRTYKRTNDRKRLQNSHNNLIECVFCVYCRRFLKSRKNNALYPQRNNHAIRSELACADKASHIQHFDRWRRVWPMQLFQQTVRSQSNCIGSSNCTILLRFFFSERFTSATEMKKSSSKSRE